MNCYTEGKTDEPCLCGGTCVGALDWVKVSATVNDILKPRAYCAVTALFLMVKAREKAE